MGGDRLAAGRDGRDSIALSIRFSIVVMHFVDFQFACGVCAIARKKKRQRDASAAEVQSPSPFFMMEAIFT